MGPRPHAQWVEFGGNDVRGWRSGEVTHARAGWLQDAVDRFAAPYIS